MKFNKKLGTAIITGGDKGVGRSIVIELAKAGYNIAFTYSTNLEKAKDTLNYINEISNVKCKYYKFLTSNIP